MFGYNLDENNQRNMNFSARVLSLVMALKYMEPFVEFRNIFQIWLDNIGFWSHIKLSQPFVKS